MFKKQYASAFRVAHILNTPTRFAPLRVLIFGALSILPLMLPYGVQAQKPQGKARPRPAVPKTVSSISAGRNLFQKNCAACHGAKGEGGEGPNLQKRTLSDSTIGTTIKNGVEGEMPAFGSKFKDSDVKALTTFVHSLKK